MALKKLILLISISLLFGECTTVQHISKTDVNYTVISDTTQAEDAEVKTIIDPYKTQLDAVMNEVLAVLPAEMPKQKPESTLGNWVSDAITERLRRDGYQVDVAVVNYGGLRLPSLSAGPLTMGEVFELSPFDNTLVIVDVPGVKLDSFFLLVAENDGWPISKDARLVIGNKKLISAEVAGEKIQADKVYKLATIDYVATGGDNMKVLIPLTRKQTGLLFRDVLIDNVREATASGRQITGSIEGRIINN